MFRFFYEELSNLKSNYPFIFGSEEINDDDEDTEISLGYTERDEFVDEYGHYMEMVYLYLQSPFGNNIRFEDIFKIEANQFLFIAQYLIRKRKIENLSNKRKQF